MMTLDLDWRQFGRVALMWIVATLWTGLLLVPSFAYADADASRWVDRAFDESDYVHFQTSLATVHFHPKDEHNNQQNMINFSWYWKSGYFLGAAIFKNSFHQPSQFGYMGRKWVIPGTRDLLYGGIIGGFIHGYDGEHKEDIPLNDHGVAPAILPLLGIRYKHVQSQLIFFGTAGITWTLGFDIPVN